MSDITGRSIKTFRCYKDPMIPPKPRNAFQMGDGTGQVPGTAEITTMGVYVKTKTYGDYVIPYANVESIQLLPQDVIEPQIAEEVILRRPPGRPPKAV